MKWWTSCSPESLSRSTLSLRKSNIIPSRDIWRFPAARLRARAVSLSRIGQGVRPALIFHGKEIVAASLFDALCRETRNLTLIDSSPGNLIEQVARKALAQGPFHLIGDK